MDRFKRWVKTLIPLPIVYQSHSYDCGCACLRSVCQFYGVGPDDEKAFIDACKTTEKDGTHPDDLIRAARSFGLKAVGKEGFSIRGLKQVLDLGRPVICAIQAWGDADYGDNDDGHYVVAIGYDDDHVLFQDPSIKNNRRGRILFEDFERRWHDVDRDGHILRHYGIVLWHHEAPEDTDFDARASHIE